MEILIKAIKTHQVTPFQNEHMLVKHQSSLSRTPPS